MEKVLDFLSAYGWGGFLIICVLCFSYFLIIKKNSFGVLFSEEQQTNSSNDLKYHPFFRNARYRMNVTLPLLHIKPEEPVKQQVLIDMLQLLTKTFYDTCMNITTLETQSWSAEQWGLEISNLMLDAINIWVTECAHADIPEPIVFSFKSWAAPNFALIDEYISLLAVSKLYPTNIDRTNTFFLIMNLLIVALIGDASRYLIEWGDDLNGLKYKGNLIDGDKVD